MQKKRILFIAHNRKDRSPGQRFRFEQYLTFLEQNGFECIVSPLLNEKDDKIFYGPGNLLKKAWIVLKGAMIRKKDLSRADSFDIIFLFREAFFTGSSFFEKQFRKSKAILIFDFDDAIWIDNVSDSNKAFAFLKDASKTSKIIALCDAVFAGNSYLKDYALKYNSNVFEIPTTIDTDEYQRMSLPVNEKIVIGWSGSVTTIKHFEYSVKVLKKTLAKYPDKISVKVIGDGNYNNEELSIKGQSWNKATEIRDLSGFDIGIMPLPDDEWAKGKCGLKGLQYMALEIPTIMSPVGVNKDIIKDGENGFLASTEDEWVQKLSLLIESAELRKKIGNAGRKTVEERYSVNAIKNRYLTLFNRLIRN